MSVTEGTPQAIPPAATQPHRLPPVILHRDGSSGVEPEGQREISSLCMSKSPSDNAFASKSGAAPISR